MTDIYGTLRKSRYLILIFLLPAAAMLAVAIFLAMEETGTFADAMGSFVVLVTAALAAIGVIWGFYFVSRPIVAITQDGLVWPNGRQLAWDDVTSIEEGQEEATVVSQNTGPRRVVHEVVRVFHGQDRVTKIVTTWAEIGPQAANDRIMAAFAEAGRPGAGA